MIVESNFGLCDTNKETADIIHLLAVAPEARGFGIATKLVQGYVEHYMKKKQIILAVMYPERMLPLSPNVESLPGL